MLSMLVRFHLAFICCMLYAVVYGSEFEDIAYFSDFDKAKTKLYVQTKGAIEEGERFYPVMMCYEESKSDPGVLRTMKSYTIHPTKLAQASSQSRSIDELLVVRECD